MQKLSCFGWLAVASVALIAGCSKSPVQTGVEATTGLIKQAMAPIYPKDASAQAERMALLIADRAECRSL